MPQQKNCSFCGAEFSCGAGENIQTCWCNELPPVMPYPASNDCLCPACLRAQVEKVIAYDAVSADYAAKYGDEILLKPKVREFIGEFVKTVPPGEIICDLGCGPGQVARYLTNNLGHKSTGVDLSPKMIEQARGLNPHIDFRCADAMNLTEKGIYGGIIALYFIVNFQPRHLPTVFNKLLTLLTGGGQLLLSFHLGEDEKLRVDDLWNSGKALDFYFFKTETVTKALEEAGFRVKQVSYRHPNPAIEYPSERAYIFACKAKERFFNSLSGAAG